MAERPEFWATNVAKVLVGDQPCLLSVWLPGRTFIAKRKRDEAQRALWNAEHSRQLLEAEDDLRKSGTTKIEKERYFRITGSAAKLAGKIDLLAEYPDHWRVLDTKGAAPHDYHTAQVMIYMAVLPLLLKQITRELTTPVTGYVIYEDHAVVIEHDQARQFAPKLWAMMNRLGDGTRPDASPSRDACRFCEIPESLCDQRFVEPPDIETDLF